MADVFTESMESNVVDDVDDSEGSDDYYVSTSLFDALAAAQEASDKFLGKKQHAPDESDRLAENFLCDAFTCAVRKSWVCHVSDSGQELNMKVDWQVGDKCSALYHIDGVHYPAKVVLVKDWRDAAVVRFSGYNNEEEVKFTDMKEVEKHKKKKKRPVKKKRKIRVRTKLLEGAGEPV